MFNNYDGYEERDYSTTDEQPNNPITPKDNPITPEEVTTFRARLEEKLHNKPKSELTALTAKLGLLALTLATGLTSLLIIHNSARQSRQADVTITEEQRVTKAQTLAETEARYLKAELTYYDLLTRWNKETPANPDKVGLLQATVLNGSQEIRKRLIDFTRDRDNPHYGKPYLSAALSAVVTNRRICIDSYLGNKLARGQITFQYSDGTETTIDMSPEEAVAFCTLKDMMYLQTTKEVVYQIDLQRLLRKKKLIETTYTGEMIQYEGLKGTVNPEQVQTDVDHPWLERLWNTEQGPTIDDEFINQQER